LMRCLLTIFMLEWLTHNFLFRLGDLYSRLALLQTKPCPARRKSSRPFVKATTLSNSHSYLISFSYPSSRPQNPKVAHLTSQLLASSSASSRSDPDPDAFDEEELFAELEAEIENDDGPLREQGLKELQHEYEALFYLLCPGFRQSDKITDLGTRPLFFVWCAGWNT
jgi:hypothetical protein